MTNLKVSLLLAFPLALLPSSHSLCMKPKQQVPQNASGPVDPQFLGFGIETGSFPDYVGNESHPNNFSLNMFNSLANRTGSAIPIRVGGTSMDHSVFDPSQNKAVYFPDGDNQGHHSNMTLGAPWLQSFSLLEKVKWTIMVPLARKNLTNAITFANASIDSMAESTFDSIEIGNEPDLYPGDTRCPHYNINDFVDQWRHFANVLSIKLTLPSGPNFWALSLHSGTSWNVSDGFDDGLSNETGKLRAISQHYYQTTGDKHIQGTLLNHTETTAFTSNYFNRSLTYLQKLNTSNSIPLILGEVGSAIGGRHKNYELQATLGSAIWTVDWLLYAMSIGVYRVNMQLITTSPFAAWQPVCAKIGTKERPAQVLGGWYGHVFVADILGAAAAAGGANLQVYGMELDGEYHAGGLVAYSIYHDEKLAQVVVLNEKEWKEEIHRQRPTRNVTIGALEGVEKVKVQRLTGVSGTAVRNITWAGERWSKEGGGTPVVVRNDTTVHDVRNKAVDLVVGATEGILVSLLS